MAFVVSSSSFSDGDYIGIEHVVDESAGFGCAGGNVSPALAWNGAPDGTKSYAITCYDPDAPTGSGFWHWLLVDIPADVESLAAGAAAGALPGAAQHIRNDYGTHGYGGPCPPEGDHAHRYFFTVFALSVDALGVNESTSAAVTGFLLNANSLGKAELMGLYRR